MAQELGIRVTRRQAFGAAGAAVIAAAAHSPVAFALVGAGSWGRTILKRLERVSSGRLVAICDSDEQALKKTLKESGLRPTPELDYRRLLDRKDIEAVLVATPLHTHFAIVRDALNAGKHVFCENCLVFRASEAAALKALVDSKPDLIVQVGLQRRASRFYQIARQMAAKGFIGEVTHILTQWHSTAGWKMIPDRPREKNWQYFREFSGGLASEVLSHQIDVANWVFADNPDFVAGVGGLDWRKDGRDVYDNIVLTCSYPYGKKLVATAVTSSRHLSILGAMPRTESAEVFMGTDGAIEISLGGENEKPLGLWFYEPGAQVESAANRKERAVVGGATIAATGGAQRGFPILLDRDQISGNEPFLERELKYARRWLYSKGITVPEEDRHPLEAQFDDFFTSVRTGKAPRADADIGLNASSAAILANLALDEGRRVQYAELEGLAKGKSVRKSIDPGRLRPSR